MALEEYLIDETLFVRAVGRTKNDMIGRLILFLSYAKRREKFGFFRSVFGLDKKLGKRRFKLKMTTVSRKRLGMTFLHISRCKRKAKKDPELQAMYSRRVDRAKWARKVVEGRVRRSLWEMFWQQELIDLYAYANEKKSIELLASGGEKLHPEEVIPLETCLIALLANKSGMELLSFNTDFRHFKGFRGIQDYLRYKNMKDFLSEPLPK